MKVNRVKTVAVAFSLRLFSELKQILATMRRLGPNLFQLWSIAAIVGGIVGLACHYFIISMHWLTQKLYFAESNNLIYWVHDVSFWWIICVPCIGGLLTGIILNFGTDDARARSISHVVEGAALQNGYVDEKKGLYSTLASFVSLSFGGSAGKEGPLVHMGAVIASRFSRWINANGITARDLLAGAAAAAIGASFNAPIAGILFAHEIILRHHSVSSVPPIALAAVSGTITGHWLEGGDFAEIQFFQIGVTEYSELPAFLILGLLSGLVAVLLVRAVFIAEDTADQIQEYFVMPNWIRPALAGLLLGVIATQFPHIIGVGYQTTGSALLGNLTFVEASVLVFIKIIAVAITLGGRMAGGIFSPSLMVGALLGLAFGIIATEIGGDVGNEKLYALAGMAAVSAAVLGAPLSTSIIIFEMTRDWQAALAVLASVSMACGIAHKVLDKGFFFSQLERRDLHIAAGPQVYLLATFKVSAYLKPVTQSVQDIEKYMEQGAIIYAHESFEEAMPKFERLNTTDLLVLPSEHQEDEPVKPIGRILYLDVLRAYSHALADTSAEEHD